MATDNVRYLNFSSTNVELAFNSFIHILNNRL